VTNVVLRPFGASDRTGPIPFHVDAGDFNLGVGHYDPRGHQVIETVRLDDDLRSVTARVSLVKIDVEGMELAVLRGAQLLLTTHRPTVVVEHNPSAWTLSDLRQCIPYGVEILQVPVTLRDRPTIITQRPAQGANLLVRPRP
jgi:hypothetical protein